MIRVAIVDDQPLVRAGIRMTLEPEPDLTVVGEGADGDGAVDLVAREQPDVLLLDVQMPGRDGLDAAVVQKVRAALLEEKEVCDIHDLHIWTITSRMYALTAHVHLKKDLPVSESEELGRRLQRLLDERFEINHATLQFEVRPAGKLECEHEHEPAAGPH